MGFFGTIGGFLASGGSRLVGPAIMLLLVYVVVPLTLTMAGVMAISHVTGLRRRGSIRAVRGLVSTSDFGNGRDGARNFSCGRTIGSNGVVTCVFGASTGNCNNSISIVATVSPRNGVLSVTVLSTSGRAPNLKRGIAGGRFCSRFGGGANDISVSRVSAMANTAFSSGTMAGTIGRTHRGFSCVRGAVMMASSTPRVRSASGSRRGAVDRARTATDRTGWVFVHFFGQAYWKGPHFAFNT